MLMNEYAVEKLRELDEGTPDASDRAEAACQGRARRGTRTSSL